MSRDHGDSWMYFGEEITPHNIQVTTALAVREHWEKQFNERIIPQLELNPAFLPLVTGKFQGGLGEMVKEDNILFAEIIDVSSNEGKTIGARSVRRLLFSTDNGESWMEIVPPAVLLITYQPSLAIEEQNLYFTYSGTLWRFPLPT